MRQEILKGVRIIDFSWVVAGPMTTKMLAAMGAEVIKVESTTRPEFKTRNGFFAVLNDGKRSITVNIASEAGQGLLRRLAAISDVVVENFSGRVLRKYQLSYDDIRKVRPDIVFCSASGVGRTGPLADVLAYGTLLQGFSGRAGLVGEVNLDLEGMGIVPAWTDPVTAMWETSAILAALRYRGQTGEGSYIDLSMLESTIALLPEALLRSALGQEAEIPGGNREPRAAPAGCFRCIGDDNWLAVAVETDAEWHALARLIGRNDLSDEPAYEAGAGRIAHKAELNAALAAWLAHSSAEETERRLQAAGVPAARSRSMKDLLQDPNVADRRVFPTGRDGKPTISLPWRDEEGWRGDLAPAAALGADNEYVFGDLLGLSKGEIDELVKADVIA